jgi:DNA-binding MarR family transcriptional regulator
VTALPKPTSQDFKNLLAFRVSLRRFQRWSEDQAGAVGLTHVQHQLLVAVKGHPGRIAPTIGDLAGYLLLLRHHSMVELVNRAEAAGFVRRRPDAADARVVRVELTEKGDQLVTQLTRAHLAELHDLAAALHDLIPDEEAPPPASAEGIGLPAGHA